jgi:hypothetical protein
MKKLVLVFIVALAFSSMAMASDIAFYVGAPNIDGWYDVDTMTVDVETIIAESGHLFSDIQKFDDDQFDDFGAWVDARTNNGVMDILWLNGCVPSVLYPFPNLEPDGSRIEEWLDGGNMIINVGDWFGYVSYEGGPRQTENGTSGAANILDLSSGIIVSADNTSLTVTPTGQEYLPSLNDSVITYRPIVLSAVVAPWEVAAIFASTGGTDDPAVEAQADPVVIHNTETDGYVAFINQSAGSGPPGWIDDRGLTCAEFINNWVNEVIGLGRGNPIARSPNPKDGALHEDTWVTLSWKPGVLAVSHDVYLGDNYDTVSNAAPDSDVFRGNQGETFLVAGFPGFPYPDGLVPGTTYYWRIDEVNDADPNSPWKGNVWSFLIPPKTAYNPDPADGAEFVGPDDVTLTWTPGFGAKLHTVYFGETFDEINDATGGAPGGIATYRPGPLELEKVYYWRVDEFDALETYKGDVWSFTTPGAVGNPRPAYRAADVGMNATLSWTPADSAASHELYFGTDEAAVRSADTGAPEYKGSKALGAESHDPGLLDADTAYYWRVDEVDGQGNTTKGPLWIFTTGHFLLVDDFESYTDDDAAGEAIWQTWIDGFGVADNGAQAGNLIPPYCEQAIVHGGSQSMPLFYTNEAGVTNSEVSMTLTAPRDWTLAGVVELSLWFRGSSNNATEPLYVSVANSGGAPSVVAHVDAGAAAIRSWTQWRIALQALSDQGINLGNVDKIAIGLGSKGGAAAGGTGTMYIDDIRLCRP